MHKFYLVLLISVSLIFFGCKGSKTMGSEKAEVIFSVNTTPCFGNCPVYELSLYGDKLLTFEGKQNTNLEGKHEKILSDEQFEALLGIVEAADWSQLKSSYTSDMTDLPTQNFSYTRNGISKQVSKYGSEPKELNSMSDTILKFAEEQVFKK